MRTLPETVHGQADPFLSTQWSLILAAGQSQADPESSRAALSELCQTYWPSLYTFVRARGYTKHDAQDLTQGFFAHLIEHKIYTRTDRRKGKFRSFLLASLRNFLSDARDHDQALKRGGGRDFVPLEEAKAEAAESLFQTHGSASNSALAQERLFDRSWAETVVTTALDRLGLAYKNEGKENLFGELRIFLTLGAAPLPTYAELAARLGVVESTLRSHVTRLRARYREVLRGEVRRTVNTEREVDGELRELLRLLTGP